MRRSSCLFALLGLLAMSAGARADDTVTRLAAQLKVQVTDIHPAPVAGLYQVTLGPEVTYVTADGRYLLRGDIVDVKSGKDLTREQRDQARLAYIGRLNREDMIVFPVAHPKHVLTVLTDIDCQYCRAIAREMPELTAAGVELHYLAYPRAGVGSSSWDKAVAVWCAKDRQAAYRDAMAGKPVTSGKCDEAPVAAGYDLAQRLGGTGTPVIITETGQLIDGYVPAAQLVPLLDDPAALALSAD
ncbi:MAG TPA: DsbC family protein [Gammaproteobacteria bacterium]|nr:DsbC family protein [Gammaproteobacteria bacterium]